MAAATVGGALEAFDILMYGYLAVVLSSVSFRLAIPQFLCSWSLVHLVCRML
jgi:hypothetical protein